MARKTAQCTIRQDKLAQINTTSGVIGSKVMNAGETTVRRAQDNIRRAGRIDTGRMLNSVSLWTPVYTSTQGIRIRIVANAPYSSFQHDGVRPFGPKKAKVLRFKPKGSRSFIFRPWVRGFTGVPFLKDAAQALSPSDFR